jgi:hypothetical protein
VALRALGFNVKKGDVLELLQKYDKDETSTVTFEEFNSISKFQPRLPSQVLVFGCSSDSKKREKKREKKVLISFTLL